MLALPGRQQWRREGLGALELDDVLGLSQMAGDVLPAFDPGPHFAVSLRYRGFHPLYPLLNNLAHRLALFHLPHLVLVQRLGDGRATLGLEAVDLAGLPTGFLGLGAGLTLGERGGLSLAGTRASVRSLSDVRRITTPCFTSPSRS